MNGIIKIFAAGLIGTAVVFYMNKSAFAAVIPSDSVPENLKQWREQVQNASIKFGIPRPLIYAIIKRESDGNSNAINQENNFASRGLMQISGPAARDMGYKGSLIGLFDPQTNINYGTKYLKWLFDQFSATPYNIDSKWRKVISAYNIGIGNVRKHGIVNPDYVEFIIQHFKKYREKGG